MRCAQLLELLLQIVLPQVGLIEHLISYYFHNYALNCGRFWLPQQRLRKECALFNFNERFCDGDITHVPLTLHAWPLSGLFHRHSHRAMDTDVIRAAGVLRTAECRNYYYNTINLWRPVFYINMGLNWTGVLMGCQWGQSNVVINVR